MNITKKIKNGPRIAVFARNFPEYLESAFLRNKEQPEQSTTFRSSTVWKSAHLANELYGDIDIYLAPIGGKSNIEYKAKLHKVKLHPEERDSDTEKLLGDELEKTKGEGLFIYGNKKVRSLYVITHCVKLKKPFPMTKLVKLSDNKPISENFNYNYCLVHKFKVD